MKRIITVLLIVGGLTAMLTHFFFRKTYVKYELVFSIPDSVEFRPDAYVIVNSSARLQNFFSICKETKEIAMEVRSVNFDFDKFTYAFFFGRKITSMEHSPKQTCFDDPSPSWTRGKGKIPVFVKYASDSGTNNGIYIYRMPKDGRLREIYE